MFDDLPRERLAFLPTPLHQMNNLGESLGLNSLWIKRDDHTGFTFGGNKTRKLEFVLGDAKTKKCDTLVTVGGVQSNHCRQTAAVAANPGKIEAGMLYPFGYQLIVSIHDVQENIPLSTMYLVKR